MDHIIQNYQVRVSIRFFILNCLITIIVGSISMNIINNIYKEQLLKQEQMIVGQIQQINPDIVGEVVSAVTRGEYNKEVASKGEEILEGYGYNNSTLYKLEGIDTKVWRILTIMLLIFMAIMVWNEYTNYKIFYRQLKKMNDSLELIIAGDYRIKVKDGQEGEFYKLSKNINRLVEIVYGSINSLYQEKNFLKDMISDISHQLKTPLSTLIIYNQLLSQGVLDKDAQTDILDNSSIVLEKMEWLIINLLKIAKFEVSAVEFKKRKVDIKEIIALAVDKLKVKSLEKNISINISGDSDNLELDIEWTEEAFINIIKNAIEHSYNNGKIEITVESNLAETKVYIRDHGEGVGIEDKEHIFKRFYKGKSSKKDSVGIGLAMSKTIFQKQGGDVKVDSDNKGTVFVVDFIKI